MRRIFLVLCLISALLMFSSCTLSDIKINKPISSQQEVGGTTVVSDNNNEKPVINNSPQLGEEFYGYTFVKDGNLFVTINSASYYGNIHNAGVKYEDLATELRNEQERTDRVGRQYVDKSTGKVLSNDELGERVFVVVNITVRNENAISGLVDLNQAFEQLDPDMYSNGYATDYDFDANSFGIQIKKVNENLDNSFRNYSIGVSYFSNKGELYSDVSREHFYNLKPGESITFDIGCFLPISCTTSEYAKTIGGNVGDDLISRFCVVTSNGPSTPIVELCLK